MRTQRIRSGCFFSFDEGFSKLQGILALARGAAAPERQCPDPQREADECQT